MMEDSSSSSSSSSSSGSSFEEDAREAIAIINNNMAMCVAMCGPQPPPAENTVDHRTLQRGEREEFECADALRCINRDYLGAVPKFDGKQFNTQFRISTTRFQCILEDFGKYGGRFYAGGVDAFNRKSMSLEAKLLLPLKTMAHGVPSHCFRDYFQMSKTQAKTCLHKFHKKFTEIYGEEYLRSPTPQDLNNVLKFHEIKHGVRGQLGSLDCMHQQWKNCPVAWQQSYIGGKKKPTVVLEAVADQHLWFWHAAFGFAGCQNDINIFALSPLKSKWIDGTFAEIEEEAEAVPYLINGEKFDKTYVLVDGIYPTFSRFVHAHPNPTSSIDKRFTTWQEAARKDVERAFGVLQGKFQCMDRPITIMKTDRTQNQASCSLILHNMCVSDRVMDGDPRATHNPMNDMGTDTGKIRCPEDRVVFSGPGGVVGVRNVLQSVRDYVTNADRWEELKDRAEKARLEQAIKMSLHTRK